MSHAFSPYAPDRRQTETILQEDLVLPPDPARTIEGLRDTGYTVETALADIVDNSIAADATKVLVEIYIEPTGEQVVRVIDNGRGMDGDTLLKAMMYGSPPRPDPRSLGKFGLGLKTASTSLCRQLTVTTRDGTSELHAAQWDLDYVAEKHQWLLRRPTPDGEDVAALEAITSGSGTVVTWRKVDRLLPKTYKDPAGGHAKKAIERLSDDVREHFSVVYGRFLDETNTAVPTVTIHVNDEPVETWDPLGVALGADIVFEKTHEVELDGKPAEMTLRASVLPPRSELTEAQEAAARISADRAGFYVYREERCISAGGWLQMFAIEPHSSLCRIQFMFDHRLDDAFQIDIKKSRIEMLEDLWTEVKREIGPARHEANKRYRANATARKVETSSGRHGPSSRMIDKNAAAVSGSEVTAIDTSRASVKNSQGTHILKLTSREELSPDAVRVEAVPSLDDGLLYDGALINGEKAVQINAMHPLYERCYPESGVAAQAVDFLLWALVEAELSVVSEKDEETLHNLKYQLSHITRKLAEQLPES